MKQIGITARKEQVQKTVLLGTARILRKALEISGYWLWLDFNIIFQYSFTVCQLNNNNNNNNINNNDSSNNSNNNEALVKWMKVDNINCNSNLVQ